MSIDTDVAIIGAGPAGSVAAHRIAKSGLKVALIDRTIFPRDKSCGDGVGSRGLEVLKRMGLGEWSSQFLAPEELTMSSPDGKVLNLTPDEGGFVFGRTIHRKELDHKLVETAVRAGVELHEGTRVDHVQTVNSYMNIKSSNSSFNAKMIILADGSHARITRKLGLLQIMADLTAIRQYFQGDPDQTKRIEFHFQPWIIPGYTWIFPMNDGIVNVGTGTFTHRVRSKDANLNMFLSKFLEEQKVNNRRLANTKPIGVVKGHPLRTHLGKSRTHGANILVVGDAAGLVNPLSGEGISPGMESGEIAAKWVINAFESGDFSSKFFSGYSKELLNVFLPDWRAARIIRQGLKSPRLLNRVFSRMEKDEERALLFVYLLLNHIPQRMIFHPKYFLKLFG